MMIMNVVHKMKKAKEPQKRDRGFAWVCSNTSYCLRMCKGGIYQRLLILMTLVISLSSPASAEESVALNLDSEIEKASYGIGAKYGEGLGRDLSDLNLEAFLQGLRDAFTGRDLALSPDELRQVVTGYQQKKMAEARAKHEDLAKKNLAAGEAFLADNRKHQGVKVTDSGLQYMVVNAGEGKKPTAQDRVKVHYHGTLVDGTVFDSSVDRGEPAVFPVNGVIQGWTEVLQMMPVGSKWKVFIPSALAYGEQGTRGVIGPNSTLIFEVELLGVEG